MQNEPTAWIVLLIVASAFSHLTLLAAVIALLLERRSLTRRLDAGFDKIANVQSSLFQALERSYEEVKQSHSMVRRVMRVVDHTLGISIEETEDEDPEWPRVVGSTDEGREENSH